MLEFAGQLLKSAPCALLFESWEFNSRRTLDGNMHSLTTQYPALAAFRNNIQAVENLMTFDNQVLSYLSASLRSLKERLVKYDVDNQYLQPDKLITMVEQLRDHGSLSGYYKAMYNQCLVLTVSHFASAVRDLFVFGLAEAAQTPEGIGADESIKIRVDHLLDESVDRPLLVSEAIADGGEYSWQDLQSIHRAYTKYFRSAPIKDSVANDVIVAQAVRHVIVHTGGRVDRRLMAQIRNASPRAFDPSLVLDEAVQLRPEDVRLCGQSMTTYLERLAVVVRDARI